jgi:hypothetical protein
LRELSDRLYEHNFDPDPLDSKNGMRLAISKFQEKNDLTPTGGEGDQKNSDATLKGALHNELFPVQWFLAARPDPSAQTASIIRQDLPVLPHSSSAASLARSAFSRWTSDHDFPEIAKAPQRVP